jgi:hypothetical protein
MSCLTIAFSFAELHADNGGKPVRERRFGANAWFRTIEYADGCP